MKSSRFLPLITPFVSYLLLQVIFFYPKSLYISSALILLLLVYATFEMRAAGLIKEKWLNIFIFPAYLCLATILISIILPIKNFLGQLTIQILFIVAVAFLYYYYALVYDYLANKSSYRKESLSYFSSYANFTTVYLASSAAFGLQSFLGISIWLIMILILFFVSVTSYELMWANRISGPLSYFYISMVSLLIFELAWSVSFLTLSYYILGLLIAIPYYMLIGLVRFKLLKIINVKIVKTYLTLGFLSILIVLMTARWI